MSSKRRSRKVTVDTEKIAVAEAASLSDKRKLSVFERLGPGAPRKYETGEKHQEPLQSPPGICHKYQKFGTCPFGGQCRYKHPPHRGDRSPDEYRHHHSDTEVNPAEVDGEQHKHMSRQEKKDKIKSAVVITKQNQEDTDSDPIPDGSDEDLQRRLSQLKQELNRLDQEERERERREKAGLTAISSDESDREAPPHIIPPKHKKEKVPGEHPKKKKKKKKKDEKVEKKKHHVPVEKEVLKPRIKSPEKPKSPEKQKAIEKKKSGPMIPRAVQQKVAKPRQQSSSPSKSRSVSPIKKKKISPKQQKRDKGAGEKRDKDSMEHRLPRTEGIRGDRGSRETDRRTENIRGDRGSREADHRTEGIRGDRGTREVDHRTEGIRGDRGTREVDHRTEGIRGDRGSREADHRTEGIRGDRSTREVDHRSEGIRGDRSAREADHRTEGVRGDRSTREADHRAESIRGDRVAREADQRSYSSPVRGEPGRRVAGERVSRAQRDSSPVSVRSREPDRDSGRYGVRDGTRDVEGHYGMSRSESAARGGSDKRSKRSASPAGRAERWRHSSTSSSSSSDSSTSPSPHRRSASRKRTQASPLKRSPVKRPTHDDRGQGRASKTSPTKGSKKSKKVEASPVKKHGAVRSRPSRERDTPTDGARRRPNDREGKKVEDRRQESSTRDVRKVDSPPPVKHRRHSPEDDRKSRQPLTSDGRRPEPLDERERRKGEVVSATRPREARDVSDPRDRGGKDYGEAYEVHGRSPLATQAVVPGRPASPTDRHREYPPYREGYTAAQAELERLAEQVHYDSYSRDSRAPYRHVDERLRESERVREYPAGMVDSRDRARYDRQYERSRYAAYGREDERLDPRDYAAYYEDPSRGRITEDPSRLRTDDRGRVIEERGRDQYGRGYDRYGYPYGYEGSRLDVERSRDTSRDSLRDRDWSLDRSHWERERARDTELRDDPRLLEAESLRLRDPRDPRDVLDPRELQARDVSRDGREREPMRDEDRRRVWAQERDVRSEVDVTRSVEFSRSERDLRLDAARPDIVRSERLDVRGESRVDRDGRLEHTETRGDRTESRARDLSSDTRDGRSRSDRDRTADSELKGESGRDHVSRRSEWEQRQEQDKNWPNEKNSDRSDVISRKRGHDDTSGGARSPGNKHRREGSPVGSVVSGGGRNVTLEQQRDQDFREWEIQREIAQNKQKKEFQKMEQQMKQGLRSRGNRASDRDKKSKDRDLSLRATERDQDGTQKGREKDHDKDHDREKERSKNSEKDRDNVRDKDREKDRNKDSEKDRGREKRDGKSVRDDKTKERNKETIEKADKDSRSISSQDAEKDSHDSQSRERRSREKTHDRSSRTSKEREASRERPDKTKGRKDKEKGKEKDKEKENAKSLDEEREKDEPTQSSADSTSHGNRGDQKRHRSHSVDSSRKRQRRAGHEGEAASDWSDAGKDPEPVDKTQKGDYLDSHRGTDDRSRRSPSRSSMESRHSVREDRRDYRSHYDWDLRVREDRLRDERTRDDRTREIRPGDDRIRDDRTRDDRNREDRTRDERLRDDRTRDDRTREDRTREDRTRDEHMETDRLSDRVSGGDRSSHVETRRVVIDKTDDVSNLDARSTERSADGRYGDYLKPADPFGRDWAEGDRMSDVDLRDRFSTDRAERLSERSLEPGLARGLERALDPDRLSERDRQLDRDRQLERADWRTAYRDHGSESYSSYYADRGSSRSEAYARSTARTGGDRGTPRSEAPHTGSDRGTTTDAISDRRDKPTDRHDNRMDVRYAEGQSWHTESPAKDPVDPALAVLPPTDTPVQPDSYHGNHEEKVDEYEEISDDDLESIIGRDKGSDSEEQKPQKTGIVDVLDIAWNNLMQQNEPKPVTTGSALKRFTPASVLSKIGVSLQFAGEKLYNKIQKECQEQLEQAEVIESSQIKAEEAVVKPDPDAMVTTEADTKPADQDVKPVMTKQERAQFEFLHPVAQFHESRLLRRAERKDLMRDLGPYRRALCARRDLYIRRKLCKLDADCDSLHLYPAQTVDQDLYRQSLMIFRNGRPPQTTTSQKPTPEPEATPASQKTALVTETVSAEIKPTPELEPSLA